MVVYYLIIFGTVFLILYAYRAVHIVTKEWSARPKWIFRIAFLCIAFFVYATTTYLAVNRDDYEGNQLIRTYTIVGAITLAVTLLCICVFQLLGDIALLGRYMFRRVRAGGSTDKKMKRRTFMSKLALGVGGVVLGSFLWGTTKGKYGWRILTNRPVF